MKPIVSEVSDLFGQSDPPKTREIGSRIPPKPMAQWSLLGSKQSRMEILWRWCCVTDNDENHGDNDNDNENDDDDGDDDDDDDDDD